MPGVTPTNGAVAVAENARPCKTLAIQVAFACYAIAMFTRRLMQQKRDPTAEEFMTARGTANKWKIGWSFFASAVGAWCITSPASFAVNTGIVVSCNTQQL